MSRPTRRPSARDRLVRALAAVALTAGLVVLQACSAQAPATPLYSLVIDSSPTPLPPGEAARRAFVDSVLAGDLTYHAIFEGTAAGALTILPTSGSLDVAGHDYQLAVAYDWTNSSTARYAIRYVGGTAWVRIGSGPWKKEPRFKPDDTNSPFAFITSSRDVKFAKTETIAGQRLHRLTFEKGQLVAVHQLPPVNLTNEEYKRTRSEIVVDDEGRPVSGTTRIEGVGHVDGYSKQEISIVLDITFSKVGAEIVIKAP